MGSERAVSNLAYEAGKWYGRNIAVPFVRGVMEEVTPELTKFNLGSFVPERIRKLF